MALKTGWHLYNPKSGFIGLQDLVFFNDNIAKDHIQEDEASISISFYALPETVQENWEYYFEAWSTGIMKYDAELGIIEFPGIIVKADVNFEDETIEIKAETFKALAKRNYVYPWEIDEYNVKERSTDYNTVAWNIVRDLIENFSNDEAAPRNHLLPPAIPENEILEGDRIVKKYIWAEETTLYEAINDLFTDYSGVETWFDGVWDEETTSVYLQWGHGTKTYPQRRIELPPINIDLRDPDTNIIGYRVLKDASQQYNSVWISSTAVRGDGNFDAIRYRPSDFENNTYNERLPRLETSISFDVPVTDANKSEQAFRRLEDNDTVEKVFTLSVWDDEHFYPTQIGRRIQIQGSDYMSGLEGIVRLVGVRYNSDSSITEIDVVNLKRVYPRIPKDIENIQANNDTGKKSKRQLNAGGSSGDSEQYEITDYWGDEGQTGTQDLPEMYVGKLFNYTDVSFLNNGFDGRRLYDGITVCQDATNNIYALDTAVLQYKKGGSGYPTSSGNYVAPTIDDAPVWIKKSKLQNGNVIPWETARNITFAQINNLIAALPETYTSNSKVLTAQYHRYWFSPYIVGQRIFIAIRQNAMYGYDDTVYNGQGQLVSGENVIHHEYQVDVISAPIDVNFEIGTFVYSHKMPQQLYPFWNSFARMSNVQAFGGMRQGTEYGFGFVNRQTMTKNYKNSSEGSAFYYMPALPSVAFLEGTTQMYEWTFISYNLYLYAFPNSGMRDIIPVVYRIKLTPKGEIAKDNSWIETTILPNDFTDGIDNINTRTVGVSRGNFIISDFYTPEGLGQLQRTIIVPINEDGSTGEAVVSPEITNLYGRFGSTNKIVGEDNSTITYTQYSRALSYDGYVYVLKSSQFNATDYNFGSVQVIPAS